MAIKGIEGLSSADINKELDRGAKFVIYNYTVSVIIMTFKNASDIHFIKGGESGISKGLSFTALTILFGWWGIPWGPVYTVQSLYHNFRGGKNVTNEVLQHFKEDVELLK